MEYMTIKQAAEKWGLSIRRTQVLCEQKKVEGATKFSNVWAIPQDAERPRDGRLKTGKYVDWRKEKNGEKNV